MGVSGIFPTIVEHLLQHPSFPFYIMGLVHLQTLVFGTSTDDYQEI